VGSDAYNQKLSVRCRSVKVYLVSKGIERTASTSRRQGEKQPVADNKTAEGRAKNRCNEIKVAAYAPTSNTFEFTKKPRPGAVFFMPQR
jgi:OOP family OmpA-OmpF porin